MAVIDDTTEEAPCARYTATTATAVTTSDFDALRAEGGRSRPGVSRPDGARRDGGDHFHDVTLVAARVDKVDLSASRSPKGIAFLTHCIRSF